MSKKILDNVNMGCTWTSYIGAVDGVLRGAGMWKEELFKLMGMTGMAFHFIVHKGTCSSSVTVYDWVNEHSAMMDRIGIHTDVYQIWHDPRLNTFTLKQKDAITRIKESIDRGVAVVAWAPTPLLEFGIIYGYNDEDGVFFARECTGRPVDPLLYDNLGKSQVPILFYQLFKDKVEIDTAKAYRQSLEYAVGEWNREYHVNPDYAVGRKGYDNLIGALNTGSFDDFGAAYLLAVYCDAKENAARYLEFLAGEVGGWDGLTPAAELYRQIAGNFRRMTELFPFSGENGVGGRLDRSKTPEVLELAKVCKELEEKAIGILAAQLGGK